MTAPSQHVASYILRYAASQAEDVVPAKLHILMFVAQGLHLHEHGEPLFDEDIEVHDFVPRVPSVWASHEGHAPTEPLQSWCDETLKLTTSHLAVISTAWGALGNYSGSCLRRWLRGDPTARELLAESPLSPEALGAAFDDFPGEKPSPCGTTSTSPDQRSKRGCEGSRTSTVCGRTIFSGL